ncbi:MAG: tRNA (adenosine(37)-N6)-threonylcarbamoyltransferase complex dimerization subunit type 1 TsaB [Parvularculaceae bacterium]|nr:tRNA (adenosine(37)-N6)-threonylcarbamoyltransferase complex dimerization subunit type 1 TsaB [Parvularculaceae bacterium]
MLALGLDTALSSCSAALVRDGAVLASRVLPLEKGHAERLAPIVAEVIADAGADIADIDRVGVVVGPGGFAGVRVGVAFARGLAIGTRIKVVGIDSLAALARTAKAGAAGCVAAIVDAHRGEVYAALYKGDRTLVSTFAAAPGEAMARLLAAGAADAAAVGDGVRLVDPDASHFVDLGAPPIDAAEVARFAGAAPEPSAAPAPLYLRNPDARPSAPSAFAALLLREGEH